MDTQPEPIAGALVKHLLAIAAADENVVLTNFLADHTGRQAFADFCTDAEKMATEFRNEFHQPERLERMKKRLPIPWE